MCFKNLPIEIDAQGKMSLREPPPSAFGVARAPETLGPRPLSDEKVRELVARNGYVKDVDFDPVTRVAGALAFHAVADLKERKVLTTNSMATLFRGYEVIMKGRDPRDAIFITSRACGVCGGVHSVTSAMAIEMALGAAPPPLGIVIRNLMLTMEFQYDHPLHLFLLAGPDYSQIIVEQTNPELWERATKSDPTYAAAHNNLAIAYEHEGDLGKARVAYEKALELEPNNAMIKQNYELFKEINDRTTRKTGQ